MDGRPIRDILAGAAACLAGAGIESPRTDARVLLAHALGVRNDSLLAAVHVDEEPLRTFRALLARRQAREPLAYITGHKEFFSLDFEVGPGALIPRPETEILIEESLREFPDGDAALEVLDLGTGSGCLIVTFLQHYPHARGVGLDTSAEALVWARRNVERHGLTKRCRLALGDWNAEGVFDVIFVNPPYLTEDELAHAAPEIRRYEPRAAFAAGCDGLASYRDLAPVVVRTLKPEGLAFIEIGAGQEHAVAGILGENGLELRRSAPDLAGISRCVIAGRRG